MLNEVFLYVFLFGYFLVKLLLYHFKNGLYLKTTIRDLYYFLSFTYSNIKILVSDNSMMTHEIISFQKNETSKQKVMKMYLCISYVARPEHASRNIFLQKVQQRQRKSRIWETDYKMFPLISFDANLLL